MLNWGSYCEIIKYIKVNDECQYIVWLPCCCQQTWILFLISHGGLVAVHLLLSMVMSPLLPVWEKEGWTHVAHLVILWTIVGHCPVLLSFTSRLPQNLPLASLTCIDVAFSPSGWHAMLSLTYAVSTACIDGVVMWHCCLVIVVVMWWWSVAVESEQGLWYMVELTQRIKKDDHAEDSLQHDHMTCELDSSGMELESSGMVLIPPESIQMCVYKQTFVVCQCHYPF